jgi:serine protease AprX
MAGLIAGTADSVGSNGAPPVGVFSGIAPSARVVSLKVATADGAADVSQVIAAVNWVVEHRRDPDQNVRVLNLSFGTNSPQSYLLDPLARAVEQAWKAGIVVVAAAGNDGPTATRLDNPATDRSCWPSGPTTPAPTRRSARTPWPTSPATATPPATPTCWPGHLGAGPARPGLGDRPGLPDRGGW